MGMVGDLVIPSVKMKKANISFSINIGEKEEPKGKTPKPGLLTLRSWDFKLLERYKPFYMPICDLCCLCTFGKCDLSKGKRGACGIDIRAQQARIVLLACCIGTACHTAHARHLVDHLIEELGEDYEINLGNEIDVKMPITRVVMGYEPKTLGDLRDVISYCEEQLTHGLSATHTGQEGSYLDFESKALHMGMIDDLAREVGDIAQIISYNMPKGEETDLADLGFDAIDKKKPVILCIGHNVIPGSYIIDYLEEKDLEDEIEVCGICCTAIDINRVSNKTKIVGPLSKQIMFVRAGVADVVIVDEQCINTNILTETLNTGAIFIATNDKACHGLEDISHLSPEEMVAYLLKHRAALITDMEKLAEVAVELAKIVAKNRKKDILPTVKEIVELAKQCTECGWCNRNCPCAFEIKEAMILAKKGDLKGLAEIYKKCYSCGRCEAICERNLPIVSMITKAGIYHFTNQRYKIRIGRGPVTDVEIRKVGAPIVFGDIPGVVGFAGCSALPNGEEEVALMAKELLERKYIVVATGCSAMAIAMWKDKDGKTLYEKYPSEFKAGGLLNLGPCLANAHISGAAIKIANIFAKKPLEGNYEEIADYILNKVGAVGVAWGAMSQKAAAIATGFNRWGIPVIIGPHGAKYRRLYLSDGNRFKVRDKNTKEILEIDPCPEHLAITAENYKEALCLIPKLCMRPNDTPKGRANKIYHYVTMYEKYFNRMPPDLEKFVRTEQDIPFMLKDKIKEYLDEKNWKPLEKYPKEPTLLW
ncbi:acetyl-CoA decarbonylase/synthase complex subunit alpha [Methanocaldococcus villosus KIN24-T80]|uniref:Acetyl-CoA decarbonylase/synthase complex subunit alpha n=2 Tax=Methanocaldococcus villosus TaxID=667126 RepID=N6V1V8_9EURY|nr:acetyl-CoA decarbonylase/synthase complex subunit alpha [Methanocaldococcus villosus KIN24-T80]